MLQGFKKFILKGNVVDLAVGVVVGASFNSVVTSLVKDIINPLLGVVGGQPDFSSFSFVVNGSRFMAGNFLNTVIAFLINAAVIYFAVVLPINKLTDINKSSGSPSTKKCPECLSTIPVKARRCSFCTSLQKP